jgi:predicted nucleic acid-binding protein
VRIVLDTNVVLSALLWRGIPYRLLDAIQQRSSTLLYSSTALLEELITYSPGPLPPNG